MINGHCIPIQSLEVKISVAPRPVPSDGHWRTSGLSWQRKQHVKAVGWVPGGPRSPVSEPGVCLGGGKCACRGDIGRERSFKLYFRLASLVAQTVEESARNVGYSGSIPGLGRSPGKGIHPHSSILAWKIPWTEEAGRATVHGVAKSQTQRSDEHRTCSRLPPTGCLPGFLRVAKRLPWCPDLQAPRGGTVPWSRLRAQPVGGAQRARGWAHARAAPWGLRSQPCPPSGSSPPRTGVPGRQSPGLALPLGTLVGAHPSPEEQDDTHWLFVRAWRVPSPLP